MSSPMQQPFLDSECLKCGYGKMQIPKNGQEWHLECNECETILFCYVPLAHQEAFHADDAKYRMYAGGYGSGKTTTAAAEMVRHVLETPGGTSLIGAATNNQLEQTAQKTFMEMLPQQFIKSRSVQKNYIDLINGHRVLFRPLDDEGKARSLNLTAFWIEEASEVKYEYFVQLTTRLRNHATKQHMGILSTNPDLSWIRTEFLLKSGRIENSEIDYHQDEREINHQMSTHIAPTKLNTYLPPDFYESTAKGRPEWWVSRYLNGSFEHTEGQVYPTFGDNIVEPFEIPNGWTRLFGADFGLRDPTVFLGAAIDPSTGIVYIYDEHYQTNQTVPYHAKRMLEMMEKVPLGKIQRIVADPSGKQKTSNDTRSLYDHYNEYGIYFEPGYNRIEDGIMKVFSYFMLGKLKVFSSCVNTVREGVNYKYKPQELGDDKNADEKPLDKDNHTMDSLRYIVQELPDDPEQLMNKSYGHKEETYGNMEKDESIPFALQEDDEYAAMSWEYYY